LQEDSTIALGDNLVDMLKKHSKDSLLIALRIGLPFGWILFLICGIVYLIFGIHDDTAPSPIFFMCGFLIYLLGLGFSHHAVKGELKNRKDEPSHFWKTLGRMILLIVIGLILFFAIFLGSQFALSEMTSMNDEHIVNICIYISLAFLIGGFSILAIKWEISLGHKPSVEDGETPNKAYAADAKRG
jgi:uncharacterized membrane protein HdeD (DUF308 family)